MATWKKLIVSGSDAHLNSITASNFGAADANDSILFKGDNGEIRELSNLTFDGTDTLQFTGGTFSGSFEGTFTGTTDLPDLTDGLGIVDFTYDGSSTATITLDTASAHFSNGVVGALPSGTVSSSVLSSPGQGQAVLTINGVAGSTVDLGLETGDSPTFAGVTAGNVQVGITGDNEIDTSTGNLTIDSAGGLTTIDDNLTVAGATVTLSSVPAGTDNTVLILNSSNQVVTDEIDARVWGTTLLDGGGALVANRVPFASDNNTLTDDSNFTYNGSTDVLTINGSTFGQNVVISGDLTVNGTTTTINTTNLLVEDRFILLNSGSADPDEGGIVIDEGGGSGHAFVYDADASRFAFTSSLDSTATTVTPDAFVAAVVDLNSHSDVVEYQKNGNIKIDTNGDIYIFS